MQESFLGRIGAELDRLREQGLYRELPPVDHGAAKYLVYEGRELLNLASNNYLGLATAQPLIDASVEAARRYGASSGASRLVSGNYRLLDDLEREICDFKGVEAGLVVGSGYAANVAALSAFADRNTILFSDKLNHASIVDGATLSRARHERYRHGDMAHLEKLLEKHADHPRKFIVTDTVFSMDGDLCDLEAVVELAERHGAAVMVDEAHAAGVLGEGRGLAAELGLTDRIDIHMGTLSKAFGSYGAYLAGKRPVVDYLRNKGRSFIFSTALPPATVGASLAAVRHVRQHPELGRRAMAMGESVRARCAQLGLDTGASATPVVPIIIGENKATLRARDLLAAEGIFVGAVRPPTVPKGTSRLRLSLRADLSDGEVRAVLAGLTRMAGRLAGSGGAGKMHGPALDTPSRTDDAVEWTTSTADVFGGVDAVEERREGAASVVSPVETGHPAVPAGTGDTGTAPGNGTPGASAALRVATPHPDDRGGDGA